MINVTTLVKGDVIHYYGHDQGKAIIEVGTVKDDNLYADGVDVVGDGWRQYVGKWFICKVERNGETIWEAENEELSGSN